MYVCIKETERQRERNPSCIWLSIEYGRQHWITNWHWSINISKLDNKSWMYSAIKDLPSFSISSSQCYTPSIIYNRYTKNLFVHQIVVCKHVISSHKYLISNSKHERKKTKQNKNKHLYLYNITLMPWVYPCLFKICFLKIKTKKRIRIKKDKWKVIENY